MSSTPKSRLRLQRGDKKRLRPDEVRRALRKVSKGITETGVRKLANELGVSVSTLYITLESKGVHISQSPAAPPAPTPEPAEVQANEPTQPRSRPVLKIVAPPEARPEPAEPDLTQLRKQLDMERTRLDGERVQLERERKQFEAEKRALEQAKLDLEEGLHAFESRKEEARATLAGLCAEIQKTCDRV